TDLLCPSHQSVSTACPFTPLHCSLLFCHAANPLPHSFPPRRPPQLRRSLFPYTTLPRSSPVARMSWSGSPLSSLHSRSQRCALGSKEHTSELQSPCNLVCRLLLEKKKKKSKKVRLSMDVQ